MKENKSPMKKNLMSMKSAKRENYSDEISDVLMVLKPYAFSLVENPEDANDLMNDTYIRAKSYLHNFTPGTNLKAWVRKIMYSIFLNNCKVRGRYNCVDMEDESKGSAYSAPMFSAPYRPDQSTNLSDIRKFYSVLNEDQRIAFVMYAEQDYSYQDIADITGVSIGTVKSRISASRHKLMVELKDYATTSDRRAA